MHLWRLGFHRGCVPRHLGFIPCVPRTRRTHLVCFLPSLEVQGMALGYSQPFPIQKGCRRDVEGTSLDPRRMPGCPL